MRILVIEDDPDINALLTSSLKSACFAVDSASCGEEGSFLARTNDYDLIILDYMLPKKDGPHICRDIRQNGQTMPILMLTVRADTEDKVQMLNEGIDDYLTKPFSLEELHARVKALLRRPKQIASTSIALGDIVIDVARQSVARGKKEIYLTRKEFSLLEYMARNRGLVVSRGMIMEHVWNMESDPFSNTIEAHILNLRKKLSSGKHSLIATVPGRGYKIETK